MIQSYGKYHVLSHFEERFENLFYHMKTQGQVSAIHKFIVSTKNMTRMIYFKFTCNHEKHSKFSENILFLNYKETEVIAF